MTMIEDQLSAIHAMLAHSDSMVQMEGYDRLFEIWIKHEDQMMFYEQLIPIALKHANLLREFETRINEIVIRDNITDNHLRELLKSLSSEVSKARKADTAPLTDQQPPFDKHGMAKKIKEIDTIRKRFVLNTLLAPLGINALACVLLDQMSKFFFGDLWNTGNILFLFVFVLFIHIFLLEYSGKRQQPVISEWAPFKKFQQYKFFVIVLLSAVVLIGWLTNTLTEILILLGTVLIGVLTNALSDLLKNIFSEGH